MTAAFVISAGAAARAAWGGQRSGWLVVAGCLVSVLTGRTLITDGRFFLTFLPVLVALIGAVALRLREEIRHAQEARVAASRLEAELLKKNLQPHFLFNTLTAISEVVERDPACAVGLIEDLAGEFRALARMSGEKQVTLRQELELCRAHLRVMSVRTKSACRLESEGVDLDALVPPAIFLTLIENAHVHQRVRGKETVFRLQSEHIGTGVRYRFHSPGEVRKLTRRLAGGTGLRYIRARLEESFPQAWKLDHGPEGDGWQTVIELEELAEPSARPMPPLHPQV